MRALHNPAAASRQMRPLPASGLMKFRRFNSAELRRVCGLRLEPPAAGVPQAAGASPAAGGGLAGWEARAGGRTVQDMSASLLPNCPLDGRRAGAAWVAATGAFLLLASASVFIAVRWDRLPGTAKLGLVVALTGAFLAGGRALRRTLPATGDVLFHLGALLIPVDVAALGLRLHLGWRELLLSEGVVATACLGTFAAVTRSVVLRWSTTASVVVLAGGIAALSPLPAPLVLAVAAAALALLGWHRPAVAWATLAGLAPVAGALVAAALRSGRGSGVLTELGLGGHAAAVAALATGGLAALVLGRVATQRHDLSLVALAGTCITTGAATTWVNAAPPRPAWLVAGPALVLLVEVVALLCRRDPFWARPARAAACGAEIVAAVVATPVALALLLVAPFVDGGFDLIQRDWTPQPAAGLAWALLAGTALLAAWNRLGVPGTADHAAPGRSGPTWRCDGDETSPTSVLRLAAAAPRSVGFLGLAVGAGLVAGTGSALASAAGLVGLAALLGVGCFGLGGARRVAATVVVLAAAGWAPLVAGPSHRLASLPLGLAAAATLGIVALAWRRVADGLATAGLAAAGSAVAFCACALVAGEIGLTAAMLVSVVAAWTLAALVERAAPLAGHLVRATLALGVMGSLSGSAGQILAVTGLATLLLAVDAARHDEPLVGVGAGFGAPLLVGAACALAGVADPTTGLVLAGSAAIFGGMAVPLPARWRLPFVVAAAAGMGAGLVLAAGDPARLSEVLLLVGGLAVGAGVVARHGVIGHVGGIIGLTGVALRLGIEGGTASEALLGPVALQLVVAGWQLRRRPDQVSSWVAYGPAIALLGAASLLERLAGGPAWHGLIAGVVGVASVAVGGWGRLAGPLFLGTGLVAAVTVLESLTTLAGVPTWGWLALGGSVLMATGLALERTAIAPVEAGRRLVDVVEQRFS